MGVVQAAAGLRALLPGSTFRSNSVHAALQALRHLPPARTCHRSGRRSPAAAAGDAWVPSSALGRHRGGEVLGVVIMDAGRRTPEGDELLLDFAAAYGQLHRREVVTVANPATLERAVRGCVNGGADRVMVVPYLLSSGRREADDEELMMLLADVQLNMPGTMCVMGETLSVETLLAQHIENQVQVVEIKAPEVPAERWWRPEPAVEEAAPAPAAVEAAHATSLPPAARQAWGEAVADVGAAQVEWEAEAAPVPVRGSRSASVGATPAAASAWSDDFGAALTGGVLVVDYRRLEAAASGDDWVAGTSAGGSGTSSSWSSQAGSSNGYGTTSAGFDRPGPAYWYTNTDVGGNGSSAEPEPAVEDPYWGYGSQSSEPSGAAAAGSPWAAAAEPGEEPSHQSSWDGTTSAGAAPTAEPEREVLLEQRLASMEQALAHITDLLHAAVAPSADDDGSGGADHYSPQQLEFLVRKQQTNRQGGVP